MASAVSTQKLFSRFAIASGIHTPSGLTAAIASGLSYVDLRDYEGFAVQLRTTTSAGTGVNLVEIVAAVDTNGTNATQIKTSGAVALATNTGWYQSLECTAEEIAQLGRAAGLALRYVGARITCDNANTISSVTYIRGPSKSPHLDLTTSVTS